MEVIKHPVITEKTLRMYKDQNKVTFEVNPDSNKTEASKVIEKVYGVKVISATVTNRLGKAKYNRLTKRYGVTGDRKVMVFTLDDKSKIDLFETK